MLLTTCDMCGKVIRGKSKVHSCKLDWRSPVMFDLCEQCAQKQFEVFLGQMSEIEDKLK